ncbi:MAG TPA: cell envelope integrity protein TolA [Gammaproteobacteria bacterium]|jgi:colicin import membrane protein|nr:MAG: cell envelope integrity protein TolA [OM182 bacterium]HAL41416.1 cell envelope integrity protein TolA [Gammaproteobacteria bacterium]HBK18553.1 cell envelope integrity protein TolA [Gammaproteobacteria bacterium]
MMMRPSYYLGPLLLALGLHGVIGWMVLHGWDRDQSLAQVVTPSVVNAKLIVLKPPAKAKPKALTPKPRPLPVQAPTTTPLPAANNTPRQDLPKPINQQEALKAREALQREQRLKALGLLSEASLSDSLAQESDELSAERDQEIAQSYRAAIYDVVRQNWSRPPSARNGMKARLLVDLIPTGEVISVTLVESSGNGAFDRSAEQAIRRAKRFQVPEDNALFEAYFRRFYFLFQPEDLLR